MTERDGATVDVHHVVGDPEILHRREADGRERLVELEEVEVGDLLVDGLERALDGP